MPSHGAHTNPQLTKRLQLRKSNFACKGFIGSKNFLPYKSPFRYKIGAYEGLLDNFRVILFYGMDDVTGKVLNDTIVYRATQIEDKALLLARGISGYINHLRISKSDFPDIIHAHDYHAIPAAVVAKQKLEEHSHKPVMVLTVHLLSNKKVSWDYLGENWCGIKNKVHPVYLEGAKNLLSHKQLLKKAKLKIEAFGAMEAHTLTSVSQNYLHEEVMPQIGMGCKEKAMFHWNGCNWNFEQLLKETLEKFGSDIQKMSALADIKRYHLRKYFLTEALGKLDPEEPILEEDKVKETVNALEYAPFRGRGKVEPFSEDGPMVLMTGRLTKQKGVDLVFKAIPRVLKNIPEAKFILLLLPLEEEIGLVKKFALLTHKYRDSVRILFGKAPSIYVLAHLSSDVFVCPSKWEPFGIMALEAMATGNPVIAAAVGGLKEIVVDARQNPKNGTGVLVPKNDYKELSVALSSLLAIMQISEELQRESEVGDKKLNELTSRVAYKNLKKVVTRQQSYGLTLRENAIKRVEENFRWNKVIKMITKTYEKANEIQKQLQTG